eukprot:330358-Amphidinium_carterae.1
MDSSAIGRHCHLQAPNACCRLTRHEHQELAMTLQRIMKLLWPPQNSLTKLAKVMTKNLGASDILST